MSWTVATSAPYSKLDQCHPSITDAQILKHISLTRKGNHVEANELSDKILSTATNCKDRLMPASRLLYAWNTLDDAINNNCKRAASFNKELTLADHRVCTKIDQCIQQ